MEKNVSKFDEYFTKDYDEDSKEGYILEVDVKYPEYFANFRRDIPFLHERTKNKKCNRLACNINEKENLCCPQKSSKESINPWTNTKKSI